MSAIDPRSPAEELHDALESRDDAARAEALAALLPDQVRAAQSLAGNRERLAGIDPDAVKGRAELARLPVLRKSDLLARQAEARAAGAEDPFAGLSPLGYGARLASARPALRVFQSPGPIYEPQPAAADPWRCARALFAAGFRRGELIHNSFSYHLTPGAWIMEAGAHALGCTVFPGGTAQTELQLQAVRDLRPDGYCGTPSFLRILLERDGEAAQVASAAGTALPPALSLRKALVSGEAFPPSLRDWLAERGVAAYQAYATADVGVIAYETRAREGLVVDEGVVVEIVRPGTGEPVPDGEVGELVVTVLDPDLPLLRFGTGDLSAVLPGPCPTGRTNTRIRGWLGRADQTTKVRGMFVQPSQVAELQRRHPAVARLRLVVSGAMADDRLLLRAETAADGPAPADLAERLARDLRELTQLRGEVELVPPGTLANDGKVIEDARRYD